MSEKIIFTQILVEKMSKSEMDIVQYDHSNVQREAWLSRQHTVCDCCYFSTSYCESVLHIVK